MDFSQNQRDPRKRLIGIVVVIAIHVAAVWALVAGLARNIVEIVKAPLETRLIQESKKPPPDAPPPPRLAPLPPPFIPVPEVNIATLPTVAPTISAAPTQAAAPAPTPVTQHVTQQKVRIAAVVDAKRSCGEPQYPSASKRLEESGTVVLRFLIDIDGRVVDSKVDTSSGHERLDKAAKDALTRCTFKPGTVDGKPEQSWASIKYTWRLQ